MRKEQEIISGLLHRVESHVGKERLLVGIAGGPGSGKSTLACKITRMLNEAADKEVAVLVPMDGFHFSSKYLKETGMEHLKGAPSTFDASGFVELIKKLKFNIEDSIGVPSYSREIHDVIPNAWFVKPYHKIIVVEGNYLLLDESYWKIGRNLFDVKIFIDTPKDVCRERLIERHINGGKNMIDAVKKVDEVDLVNYDTVYKSMRNADIIIDWLSYQNE